MSTFLYYSQISKFDKPPTEIARCSKCHIFTWKKDRFVCRQCLADLLQATLYEKGIVKIIKHLME